MLSNHCKAQGQPPSGSLAGLKLSTAAHERFPCQDQCLRGSPPVAPDRWALVRRSTLGFPGQLGPSLLCPCAPSAGSSQTDPLLHCPEWLCWGGLETHTSHCLHWRSCTGRGHPEQRLSVVTHWKRQPLRRSVFSFGKFSCEPCFQFCIRRTFRRILSLRGYEREERCPLPCNALHRAVQTE